MMTFWDFLVAHPLQGWSVLFWLSGVAVVVAIVATAGFLYDNRKAGEENALEKMRKLYERKEGETH